MPSQYPKPANAWIKHGLIFHWAHRGAGHEGPPNTMWAMKQSLVNGANGLELDVHRTADGFLVVCHDPTVDDTTDAMTVSPGRLTTAIAQMTYDELRSLDAAHWWEPGVLSAHDGADHTYPLRGRYSEDHSLRIPLLGDVLDAFEEIPLNIDLKMPGYEADLAALLRERGATDRTIVASFGPSVQRYRELSPGAPTAANRKELITFAGRVLAGGAPEVPFTAAQIPTLPKAVMRRFVAGAHRSGVAVHVWTIDDPQTVRTLAGLGIDGIMTNRSSMLTPLLLELGNAWEVN